MKMSGHISVYSRSSTRRFRCRPQTHPQPFRDGKHNGVAGYSLFTIAQEENDYTIVARLDAPGSARQRTERGSGTICRNDPQGALRKWFLTPFQPAGMRPPQGAAYRVAVGSPNRERGITFLTGYENAV
jgi:hypothetical protein